MPKISSHIRFLCVTDAREGTDTTLHASNSAVQSQLRARIPTGMYCSPIYSRVYARSIAIDDGTVLTHPAVWTPLACLAQQAWNSTLDAISVMAIAWGVDTLYVSVPSHRGTQGTHRAMPMCTAEWLHWLHWLLLFLLQNART
jgi:hypothetical protein